MAIELTASEVRQCYHGLEFALTDLRKAKKDDVLASIMSKDRADEIEKNIIALKEKLLAYYYELGGE